MNFSNEEEFFSGNDYYSEDLTRKNFKQSIEDSKYEYEYFRLNCKKGKPNVLSNDSFLKCSDYTFIFQPSLEDSRIFDKSSEIISDSNNLYESLKRKKIRYFHFNITKKCHTCNEIGHTDMICPNIEKKLFCKICRLDTHMAEKCPFIICYRCHKPFHKISDCKTEEKIKCKKCKSIGHEDLDCLIFPEKNNQINESKNVHCYLCKQQSEKEHDEKILIFSNSKNIIQSCPACGEGHKYKNCSTVKKIKNYSQD